MSFGLYDYNRRYRRRFWSRLVKVLLGVGALLLLGAFSYQLGVEQLKSRLETQQAELAEMTAARDQAERRAAQFQTAAQNAEIKAKELEVRYTREVPTGELARLRDLLARKLAEGVDAGRLAFVIEQTGNQRACTPPERKRFVLATPIYKGSNTSVIFADGALTVTGEGVSARTADGNPEAWFDPTKPVTVRFVQANGPTTEATGLLPLQHSVVIGTTEHRFTLSPGSRSFVEVSSDRCPFP
ncbi:MAG TPA: hypothetical protein VEB20_16470 [Azospirillaceae bacterium]|nr:hypothetical protein [Azospirillaceae bacterium]